MTCPRVHWAAAFLPLVVTLAVGCASGKSSSSGWRDGKMGQELGGDQAADAYVWPDQRIYLDAPTGSDLAKDGGRRLDLGADASPDLLPPDSGSPDSGVACPDIYEPNQSCAVYNNLGSIGEGGSWSSRSATIAPGTDVDWFRVEGNEGSHTCLPFTSQKYYFKVRVTVPAGRVLRVCLRKGSCSAALACADNLGKPGPTQLNVQYKVSGTCAINDDTTAYFKVESADGKGACDTYTVAFNYN